MGCRVRVSSRTAVALIPCPSSGFGSAPLLPVAVRRTTTPCPAVASTAAAPPPAETTPPAAVEALEAEDVATGEVLDCGMRTWLGEALRLLLPVGDLATGEVESEEAGPTSWLPCRLRVRPLPVLPAAEGEGVDRPVVEVVAGAWDESGRYTRCQGRKSWNSCRKKESRGRENLVKDVKT